MDVKWTSEQKKVIDLRDRDILVDYCIFFLHYIKSVSYTHLTLPTN